MSDTSNDGDTGDVEIEVLSRDTSTPAPVSPARQEAGDTNWLGMSGVERLRLIEAAPHEMHGFGVWVAQVRVQELAWLCDIARKALAVPPSVSGGLPEPSVEAVAAFETAAMLTLCDANEAVKVLDVRSQMTRDGLRAAYAVDLRAARTSPEGSET